MKVGFLGTGRIAAPMVEALARQGHEINVSRRGREVSTDLAERHDNVLVYDNQGVLDHSEVVVLCLLAATARQELPRLSFSPEHKVISAMAEISLEEIAGMIGETGELCVTIPMPFIHAGGCPLPVHPDSPVLEALFGAENTIIPLESEAALKPHFAATAVSSTIFKELITVRDWLGRHAQGPEAAERYMALLVSGYLNGLPKDGKGRLDEAVEHLATAGGLNAQLLAHMIEAGTMDSLEAGLEGLVRR